MVSPVISHEPADSVELVEDAGEWSVRVTESGATQTASFERLEFAESWSFGQALRLGVEVRRP